MDQINSFEDLLESIPNYGKIVLSIFLIRNDAGVFHGYGFLNKDITRLFFILKKHQLNKMQSHFSNSFIIIKKKPIIQQCSKKLETNGCFYYCYQ